ncbi:MAG: secondary thiamine-phosphate synthase enzyme YjbQ [Acidobacteriota bacterium]|nr:secondary thiamine-phosphate synthase enzyme YjbQ [Blastocatellia bacterium]MDW8413180.1 secondary thiamine-phosphate synthase enzyme YjbQ [Acidobacteriota bacterium]
MKLYQETIEVQADATRRIVDITSSIQDIVARSEISTGICNLFLQHTSASICIQENSDPTVLRDLERWMKCYVPEDFDWEHDLEGRDDMPAHLRSMLCGVSLQIPIVAGRLALGTWQAVYIWEHRARPLRRSIVVTAFGEGK